MNQRIFGTLPQVLRILSALTGICIQRLWRYILWFRVILIYIYIYIIKGISLDILSTLNIFIATSLTGLVDFVRLPYFYITTKRRVSETVTLSSPVIEVRSFQETEHSVSITKPETSYRPSSRNVVLPSILNPRWWTRSTCLMIYIIRTL
jgi:hypothetical protein